MKANVLLCRSAIAKMSAAAIILTLAVAIAGAAYYLTLPAPSPSPSPSPTSTPAPSPSPSPTPTPTPALIIMADATVFEGERWVKIFDNGTVRGYSYHLYPDYKDIEIREGNVSREEIDTLLELFSNLAGYEEHEVNVSRWGGGGYLLEPLGYTTISCLPLNKTLELHFLPSNWSPIPETITAEAVEILARIDKIYGETVVVERIKEINPYSARISSLYSGGISVGSQATKTS